MLKTTIQKAGAKAAYPGQKGRCASGNSGIGGSDRCLAHTRIVSLVLGLVVGDFVAEFPLFSTLTLPLVL